MAPPGTKVFGIIKNAPNFSCAFGEGGGTASYEAEYMDENRNLTSKFDYDISGVDIFWE